MNRIFPCVAATAAAALCAPALAQQHDDHGHHSMPEQPPAPAPQDAPLADGHQGHGEHVATPGSPTPTAISTTGSGTARLPGAEGGMHGLHITSRDWMLMAHGYAWAVHSDQGGPRGGEKQFVQSMAMVTAEAPVADSARLQLRSMFSLEPLMSARGYPNLFATGETAGGEPLIDRQHPHDFFMELAARLDVDVAPGVSAFLYGGPVGEPALGPSAFMMRRSARYNAEAPISHHWFDSTHITYGVATAGLSAQRFQLEASAFRGREPDEQRWDIETPKFDSWSVRASVTPSPNWAAQISYGRLQSPEVTHPGEDEGRFTASVHYSTARLAVTAAYSAKNRLPGPTLEAWLVEANWNPAGGHNLFGRIERVENDELFDHHDPLHGRVFTVTKAAAGYAYRIPLGGPFALALGGSAAIYDKPRILDAAYGRHPISHTLFAKLSLGD